MTDVKKYKSVNQKDFAELKVHKKLKCSELNKDLKERLKKWIKFTSNILSKTVRAVKDVIIDDSSTESI